MKTRLIIAILAATVLFCSCKGNCSGCGKFECYDVVKPADLKPIDWNGWNDAYTVCHTFYDKSEDAQMDHYGDTIRCYGCISKYLYEDYSSLSKSSFICFECSDDSEAVAILHYVIMNSCDRDSLVRLLDDSSYSDTCYVKGIFGFWGFGPEGCDYVKPAIYVNSIDNIHFKKSQP